MSDFLDIRPDAVAVDVRLTPRSGKDAVEGLSELADGRAVLAARVRAVPEKGKANKALEKTLADWLGVAKSRVKVVSGSTSRIKTVEIAGDPADLVARIENRLKADPKTDKER